MLNFRRNCVFVSPHLDDARLSEHDNMLKVYRIAQVFSYIQEAFESSPWKNPDKLQDIAIILKDDKNVELAMMLFEIGNRAATQDKHIAVDAYSLANKLLPGILRGWQFLVVRNDYSNLESG